MGAQISKKKIKIEAPYRITELWNDVDALQNVTF